MSTKDNLKNILGEDPKVYTIVRSVSQSGMSRRISVFAYDKSVGDLVTLDYMIEDLGEDLGLFKHRANQQGLFVQGVGMDMTFHLVSTLSQALYDDPYKIKHSNL